MSLTDIQNQLVAKLQEVIAFNNDIEAKVQQVLTSKNQLTTDVESLMQAVQSSGVPVPAAVSSAVAEFANAQPMIEEFAVKAEAIITAQNTVLTDLSEIIAPAK